MILVEIVLTIVAWRRGWKALALWPIAICLGVGFLLGIVIASSGGSVSDIPLGFVSLDIMAVIALIVMCFKPRVKPESTTPTST